MFVLDSVACADTFPADGAAGGAQLIAQNGSNGGYFAVTGADVYVQLGFSPDGVTIQWTPQVHVGQGNGILQRGTYGVRFRNYVAGSVATVSAGLSEPQEPSLQLTAAGVSTPVATINGITGRVSAAGAILAGSGYSITKGAAGVYTVNFTPVLAAVPIFLATVNTAGGYMISSTAAPTNASVPLSVVSDAGILTDQGFSFLALAVQ